MKQSVTLSRKRLPRLLLVNDQSFLLFSLKMQLETRFKVWTAENGLQAAQLIEEFPADYFSAVLLDINMPIMDGFKSCLRMVQHLYADALEQQGNDSFFGNVINVPLSAAGKKDDLKNSVSMFQIDNKNELGDTNKQRKCPNMSLHMSSKDIGIRQPRTPLMHSVSMVEEEQSNPFVETIKSSIFDESG